MPSEVPSSSHGLKPEDKQLLKELRAMFVASASLDNNGRVYQVSFFPPDVVQSAILAQMSKEATPSSDNSDISGQSSKVMELRAKLAACDSNEQRVELLRQLNAAQMEETMLWSST
jgi:hypothetical protein